MPMAEDVDYRAFSVFINITDYSGWLQDRMEWEIHPTIRPYHVLNPWTWLPEVSHQGLTLEIYPTSPLTGLQQPIAEADATYAALDLL